MVKSSTKNKKPNAKLAKKSIAKKNSKPANILKRPTTGRQIAILATIGFILAGGLFMTLTMTNKTISEGLSAPNINSQVIWNYSAAYALNYRPADGTKLLKKDATKAYQKAGDKIGDFTGANTYGKNSWNDCGRFVGTIMRVSGLDTSYPKLGATTQLKYVSSNTSKYSLTRIYSKSNLLPGDIIFFGQSSMNSSHTGIMAGDDSHNYFREASWGKSVPRTRSGLQWWFDNYSHIYRGRIKDFTVTTNPIVY